MIWQIQGWPTPEIFIRRNGRILTERFQAALALQSATADGSVTESILEQPQSAALSLESAMVFVPESEAVSDSAFPALALQSAAADGRVTEGLLDTQQAALALESALQLVPNPESVTDVTQTASLAMQSAP